MVQLHETKHEGAVFGGSGPAGDVNMGDLSIETIILDVGSATVDTYTNFITSLSAPRSPQLSTETITFDVGSATVDTYTNFITSLRDKLKSSTSYFEIPMLPPPSSPPKYIYVVLKSSEQKSITLGIAMSDIYVCGYSDLYQGKVQARFFNDAPTDAKQTLFPEAKGSLRENVGYDGVYSKIEQKAGKNREGVELGITILNSRINKLVGKSKTAKDFVKTEAEFFLIAIQMVSEAARFKYVENEIKDGPSTPDQKAICLEGMWGKISEAIKGADPKTAQIPTALSDKLALCQSDGISWKVTNVNQIKSDMGLLKYVA
ncbi:hypothetical protein Cgig2_015513 [Carnegiea gigantea]|uniref:rRNA N-glycosylase n=1 Tax=Carnegiea gigantea TaxID=171969 RepID=A0A9Q1KG72_9CARY|nr:hypothetical protein Cgig2_015513 [Carnegiea gigantea]